MDCPWPRPLHRLAELERWGIPREPTKSVEAEILFETTCVDVDDERGISRPNTGTILALISPTSFVVNRGRAPIRWLEVTAGRWCHAHQSRRPLMGVFGELWNLMSARQVANSAYLGDACQDELFLALVTLPL